MTARHCRSVAMLLLVVHLGACATWRPSPVQPGQLIEQERPSSVRVTLTSGQVVTLRDPQMVNDSIVGLIAGGFVNGAFVDNEVEAAVASRDVASMEVRRVSAGNTLVLVALGSAALFGGYMLAYLLGS